MTAAVGPRLRSFLLLAAAVIGLGMAPSALTDATSTPAAAAADTGGEHLRVATFNVRTARAVQDKRQWLERAPQVAGEILSRDPGVVALQELGPGRADGKRGTLHGTQRQTTSLLDALAALGASQYRLVRTTPYVAPGTSHGTQGARILYDSSRYALQSDCPDTTDRRSFSSSCSVELPTGAGDGGHLRRTAAFARFRDLQTDREFWVVSAHLDSRHSRVDEVESAYNELRARQARYLVDTVSALDTQQLPVAFGGDLNSWPRDRGHYAPHQVLVDQGYRDAVDAQEALNADYPTINHFRTELKRARHGWAARLDVVMIRGGEAVERYENKTEPVDPARPSDHNMVVADFVL